MNRQQETSNDSQCTAIEDELSRMEESATYSSQSQFAQAKLWQGVNLLVGLAAGLLAAILGGTALAGRGKEAAAANDPGRGRVRGPRSYPPCHAFVYRGAANCPAVIARRRRIPASKNQSMNSS
jgi:hypothetical protein